MPQPPASPEPSPHERAASATGDAGSAEVRDRILVIEDDDDTRSALALLLGFDYEVLSAARGEEGLAIAREEQPALVLTDLTMPGLNGFEVTQRLKGDPATRAIPVILLTGRGELALKLKGFRYGVDDYLQKPCEPRELRARVRAHLANRRLARELQAKNEELEQVLRQLKAAQERLLEAERHQTALGLAASLAHEVNNPLSGILGFCELLRESLPEGGDERKDVETIISQARRIANVVRRITQLKEVRFVPYVGEETMVDLELG